MEDEETLSLGVRVIMEEVDSHPCCPHGPSLLFARTVKGGKERKFYACSAYRNRKDCSFFQWENEKVNNNNGKFVFLRNSSQYDHSTHMNRSSELLKLPARKRGYCHTCSCLFNGKEKAKHISHDVVVGVSDYLFRHPSKLLKHLECSKKEAQYMFSSKSEDFIVKTLDKLEVTSVICIGAPRIHENLSYNTSLNMETLLLDIDERYYNFYTSDEFCRYNMFNNHFFGGDCARRTFFDVISDESQKVAVVIDPPFGGRVEPLAFTLRFLQQIRKDFISSSDSPMPVLWAFPYFMEPYIIGSCPGFTMLDYKVEYENHSNFKEGRNKRGSPVRIFTNVPASEIPLPEAEGYRYCSTCDRWVSPENKHCQLCNSCTSKDGRTYRHCKMCKRCVKPTWVHCSDCGRCCLPKHSCGLKIPNPVTCFCGSLNHLAEKCPLKGSVTEKQEGNKRKIRDTKLGKKECSQSRQQISCKGAKKRRI